MEMAGLAERLHEVPLAAGNYTRLRTEGKRLLLLRSAATGPQPGDIQLMDAAAKLPTDAAVLARSQVRWADWQMNTQPAAEWRQMFDAAWRLHRDHFYDASMHGADRPALRARYDTLLPRVGDRRELGELQAQMVAEVGALHSQVGAEDVRRGPEDIAPAGFGARRAKVADGFRIEQRTAATPNGRTTRHRWRVGGPVWVTSSPASVAARRPVRRGWRTSVNCCAASPSNRYC